MLTVNGFTVIVPPDWSLIDVADDAADSAKAWADARVRGYSGQARRELRSTLIASMRGLLTGLKGREGLAVLAPSGPLVNPFDGGMLVFRRLMAPDGTNVLDMVVATAAADASGTLLEGDVNVCLRTHQDVEVGDDAEAKVVAQLPPVAQDGLVANADGFAEVRATLGRRFQRHVRYQVGRPDLTDRWLDVTGSIAFFDQEDSRALAEAQMRLFDTIVGNLTWQG